jgi:hypothetical protein
MRGDVRKRHGESCARRILLDADKVRRGRQAQERQRLGDRPCGLTRIHPSRLSSLASDLGSAGTQLDGVSTSSDSWYA